MRNEIANLTISNQKEFGAIRKEIGESKAENIKWMFIFWIGQVAAMLGILLLFLKK